MHNLGIFLKKSYKWLKESIWAVFLMGSTIGATFANYNEVITVGSNVVDWALNRSIDIQYSPTDNIHVGDIIAVNYKAPDHGYLSLWNWNCQGKVKLLQLADGETYMGLTEQKHSGEISLRAKHPYSRENLIILWTPDVPEALPDNVYDAEYIFRAAIARLDDYESKEISFQVY